MKTKLKIQPLGDNVLIKPEINSKKTRTGIFLPETASEEQPQEGKVMAIGDSKEIKIKKGQTVIFRKYSGIEVKNENEKYIIVKNEDILAIVQ